MRIMRYRAVRNWLGAMHVSERAEREKPIGCPVFGAVARGFELPQNL